MKKIAYIPIILIWILGACDVLDVQPYHSMPADEAITDSLQLQSAIIGSYDALQSGGYYGLDYLIWGDLPADNLKHVGITVTWAEIDNNNILADNGLVESTWAAIYRVLSRVNNAIDQIPNIDNERLSQTGKNIAEAELKFLRALAHYDLMRLFGPIPIRDRAVTSDEESLNPPRNSISEVLQIVNDDLDFAMQYLPPDPIRGRASRPAATALKARVALHQYFITENPNFLVLAEALATEVIDHPSLELETNYANLYTQEPTSESIFEVSYNEQDRNLIARYFAHTSLAGRYEFAPTDFYMNSFHPDDLRKDISIDMAGNNPYVVKFNDVASGTDPVYVLRLAEMYLIRAEAATLLQGNTDEILSDINKIRVRAGLTPANMTSYTALAIEIESQRQKEFAFEGHRWFDLVRTGRAIEVLENVTSINQTLFPIPQAEIISNDNPGMYQNEGY
ncbi:MAG: RagB/SusD family nutrient uptake outer membrane protein [Bacteroidetes bacterium]|nr:MAG: RagB/SusD family nutrient uptake outer membrane protein [Bacteroidota bacterium]